MFVFFIYVFFLILLGGLTFLSNLRCIKRVALNCVSPLLLASDLWRDQAQTIILKENTTNL